MRPAVVVVTLGLALALAVPVTWALTRPAATAGAPAAQVLAGSVSVSRPPTPSSKGLPAVTTRSAAANATEVAGPVRLTVPTRGVDAPVDAVGVAPDGQMEIPDDVDRVGWYRFGPTPGADGSAVIAGHVDDAEQGLGVLAALRDIDVGEQIQVAEASGLTTTWAVVSRQTISKHALPLDALFRRDGPPRLTLVTCGGPFLPEYRSYQDNVVVVAELAS